jgi:hypothetical protein
MTGYGLDGIMRREPDPRIELFGGLSVIFAAFLAGKTRVSALKSLWKSR